ncbi:MAG TPA: cation:proton antiporter [Fimbriimonadales bacterium]|nr:cation:proton antiporter [Fimbriimonadales bacterium]
MEDVSRFLFQIFIIYLAAQVGGEIALRLKIPSVVGEIFAGVLIGPSVFNWIPHTDTHPPLIFEVLSEIGVIFLMFSVGLETRLSAVKEVGGIAFQVAVFGVIVPFLFGWAWAAGMAFPLTKQIFIATAFVATSVSITARVLSDLRAINRVESRVILSAAVIDDILAMLLLASAIAIQPTNVQSTQVLPVWLHLTILATQAIIFILIITVFLPRLIRKHHRAMEVPASPHSPFILSITLCLGLAVVANEIGLAAIIGAFLAGTVLSEIGEEYKLENQLRPLLLFLGPIFFVVTGMKVNVEVFQNFSLVLAIILATALAFVSKLIGCAFGARSLGTRRAITIGIGMAPRGEVGIIIAAAGLSMGAFSESGYATIIMMSLLTSMIAPFFLAKRLHPKGEVQESEPDLIT